MLEIFWILGFYGDSEYPITNSGSFREFLSWDESRLISIWSTSKLISNGGLWSFPVTLATAQTCLGFLPSDWPHHSLMCSQTLGGPARDAVSLGILPWIWQNFIKPKLFWLKYFTDNQLAFFSKLLWQKISDQIYPPTNKTSGPYWVLNSTIWVIDNSCERWSTKNISIYLVSGFFFSDCCIYC